jgi:hypothetical protein
MNIKYIYKRAELYLFLVLIFILCCFLYNQPTYEKYFIFPISIILIQFILLKETSNNKRLDK